MVRINSIELENFESLEEEIIRLANIKIDSEFFKLRFLNELITLAKIKYTTITSTLKEKIVNVFNEEMKKLVPLRINIYNSITKEEYTPTIISFYDNMIKENSIFALDNSVFDYKDSLYVKSLEFLLETRQSYKKEMKLAIKESNTHKEQLNSLYEKVFKELANSLYGVLGAKSFFLFNIDVVSSITGTCKEVLLQTITKYEEFFGGRLILRNEGEFYSYLMEIEKKAVDPLLYELNENDDIKLLYKSFIMKADLEINNNFIIDTIINKYCHFSVSEENIHFLSTLLQKYEYNTLKRLQFFFNANFEEFLNYNGDLIFAVLEVNKENLLLRETNFNQITNNFLVKYLHSILKDLVFNRHLVTDSLEICDNYKRKAVFLSDTDSTFVKCKFLFEKIEAQLTEVLVDKKLEYYEQQNIIFKLVMILGEYVSDDFLEIISFKQNTKKNLWKLKSEFLYIKILLLKVKKSYFGNTITKEGIALVPSRFDEKNTEVSKSSYSEASRDFIKDICNYTVMEKEAFQFKNVFEILSRHRKSNLNDILEDQKVSLGIPGKWKSGNAYKNPFSYAPYVCGLFWNIIFQERKIESGSKVLIFKLLTLDEDKLSYEKLISYYEKTLSEHSFTNLVNGLNKNPPLKEVFIKNSGIKAISIPKGELIPKEFIPLLDLDELLYDSLDNRILRILDALGVRIGTSTKRDFATNIIPF